MTPLPPRMQSLPLDEVGRPIPWFAAVVDGKHDFRVADAQKLMNATARHLCWVCGQELGSRRATFVVGPMCVVNHVSSEPPSHHECATWSVQNCPFLLNPHKERRYGNLPAEAKSPGGIMIERNPGVTALYTTRSHKLFRVENGMLFDMGEPEKVEWWFQGHLAGRFVVLEAIRSGLSALENMAVSQHAKAQLRNQVSAALELVPQG